MADWMITQTYIGSLTCWILSIQKLATARQEGSEEEEEIHYVHTASKGLFCATNAIGDERHCVFDCPHFQGLRQQHAEIFRDSHDAMRSVMWHKDQKSVCALVLAIVNEA